jgi:TetR/AcrR family transcriptional regulator
MTTGEETPRTRMRGADRRSQILDFATQVFAERGFRGSALRDVADACQVTEPLIYKYFRSKRELFLATLEHAAQLLAKACEEEAGPGAGPLDKIRAGARVHDGLSEQSVGVGVIVQAAAEAGRDTGTRAAVAAAFKQRAEILGGLLSEAQAQGAIAANAPLDALAWTIQSIMVASAAVSGLETDFPGAVALVDAALAAAG